MRSGSGILLIPKPGSSTAPPSRCPASSLRRFNGSIVHATLSAQLAISQRASQMGPVARGHVPPFHMEPDRGLVPLNGTQVYERVEGINSFGGLPRNHIVLLPHFKKSPPILSLPLHQARCHGQWPRRSRQISPQGSIGCMSAAAKQKRPL